MLIEYYDNHITEKQKDEINSCCNNIEIEYERRNSRGRNASIDELAYDILVFLTSLEINSFLNFYSLCSMVTNVIKILQKNIDGSNKKETKKINVQIDNIKIIIPEDASEDIIKKFFKVATESANNMRSIENSDNSEIIVSNDNENVRVESLEEYIDRKMDEMEL